MEPESQENSAIKASDVDIRWPYRAGYPRLCPQPVCSRYFSDDPLLAEVNFPELRDRVEKILAEYSIAIPPFTFDNISGSIQIGYRAHPSEEPTQAHLRLIVDCIYEKEENESAKWAEAIPKLYQLVQQLAIPVTGIELFDHDYMHTCRICEPPSSSQSFVPEWENEGGYREKVLKVFENYPPMFQVMIPTGLRAIGPKAYDHTTVIYFQAINAKDDRWDEIHRQLRSVLPDSIGIEIRQGAGSLFLADYFAERSFRQSDLLSLAEVRRAGCKIGLHTPHDGENTVSGTMGGYVKTKPKGNNETAHETIYGVTNGHVLLGISGEKNAEVTMTTQDMLAKDAIDIQSPPEQDRRKHEARLTTEVAKLKQKIDYCVENDLERDSEISRRRKQFLKETEDCLGIIKQSPRVGSVAAIGFGCREYLFNEVQHELMMDVGLININCSSENHRNELYFPEEKPLVEEKFDCDTWGVKGLGKEIKVVAKLGQVGYRSWGIVNSFKADIKFSCLVNNVEGSHLVSGWAVSTPWPWSKEDPASLLRVYNKPMTHFAKPGESGTFIVASPNWHMPEQEIKGYSDIPWEPNSDLFIVGLLYGGEEKNSDLGFMIPFDAVKKEIEKLTGEEMVWPRER